MSRGAYALFGVIAAMAADAVSKNSNVKREPVTEPTCYKNKPIPKGLKKFVIDGQEVYAINETNAQRKADKLKGKKSKA